MQSISFFLSVSKMELIPGFREASGLVILATSVSSFVCLNYIQSRLKVSVHVKRILIAEGLFTLLGSIIMLAGYIMLNFFEITTGVSCGLFIDTVIIMLLNNHTLNMILSKTRNYMVSRVGKSKVIDDTYPKYLFYKAFTGMILYLSIYIIFSIHFQLHSSFLAPSCHEVGNGGFNFIYIQTGLGCLITVITFYYDVNLIKFVNNFNERNQGSMKIWSTSEVS